GRSAPRRASTRPRPARSSASARQRSAGVTASMSRCSRPIRSCCSPPGPPQTLLDGRVTSARCYGALVTLDPTGLVLVRPGASLTLGTLFRSWGQPLSPSRLTSFSAPAGTSVAVFVNGKRWPGAPGDVPLTRHAEVVLEVGPHVPPHPSYAFPVGT